LKTGEMIKKLCENPTNKYRLVKGDDYAPEDRRIVGIGENGNIDWYNENTKQFLNIHFSIYNALDWEWELYKEEPELVDFMTAFEAWIQGSYIYVKRENGHKVCYSPDISNTSFCANDIAHGKWYIGESEWNWYIRNHLDFF